MAATAGANTVGVQNADDADEDEDGDRNSDENSSFSASSQTFGITDCCSDSAALVYRAVGYARLLTFVLTAEPPSDSWPPSARTSAANAATRPSAPACAILSAPPPPFNSNSTA